MLGCRIEMLKICYIQIEIFMIEWQLYFFVNEICENFHIYHISGLRIYFARYVHNELVIMPVIIGIIAFAKHACVLSFIPLRIVQSVCCIEMSFSTYSNSHNYLNSDSKK